MQKLEKRALWDDDGEAWRLLPLSEARDKAAEERPISDPRLVRPTCFLSRQMAADLTSNEPRYRSVNVLSFDLDMPERTTADYETDVNPNVRAALTAALKDDEQLEVEAEENLPTMGIGGNGWTPGGDGLSNPSKAAAAKLAGKAAANAKKKRSEQRRRKEEDDLDALLNGSSGTSNKQAAAVDAQEQFPQSRGMLGGGRRRGAM